VSQPPGRPRVLLADDDDAICRAITRLLKPACDVVGYGPDTPTLFAEVVEKRPHIVLLDFSLPGGLNGLDVCRRLRELAPDVHVVVLTANDDEDVERLSYEAGAAGFVYKPEAWVELLPAIQAVFERSGNEGTA
jgi:DNA-binding response OmpR family regulator